MLKARSWHWWPCRWWSSSTRSDYLGTPQVRTRTSRWPTLLCDRNLQTAWPESSTVCEFFFSQKDLIQSMYFLSVSKFHHLISSSNLSWKYLRWYFPHFPVIWCLMQSSLVTNQHSNLNLHIFDHVWETSTTMSALISTFISFQTWWPGYKRHKDYHQNCVQPLKSK